MYLLNLTNFLNVITPAVAIAVLAYFGRFFGKIIADQNPFADDRDWNIEIGGVTFMVLIVQGVVGAAAALYWPHPLSYKYMHILDLIIVTMAYVVLALANGALSSVFFNLGMSLVHPESQERNRVKEFFYNIGKYVPIALVPVLFFYVATIEYLSGSIIWMILIWSTILYALTQLAMIFSIRKLGARVPVDIHFIDESQEVLKNVMILKVNDDNIRLRDGDTIIILNKNQVLKIEMAIPDKHLGKGE